MGLLSALPRCVPTSVVPRQQDRCCGVQMSASGDEEVAHGVLPNCGVGGQNCHRIPALRAAQEPPAQTGAGHNLSVGAKLAAGPRQASSLPRRASASRFAMRSPSPALLQVTSSPWLSAFGRHQSSSSANKAFV